jgi:uncharacterized protein (DUF1499 family)
MSWLDGLTKNRADLSDDSPDPQLRPVVILAPPAEAVAWAASVIANLPRWSVIAHDPRAGTLRATHTTRLWRFVDDVLLRFERDPRGTRLVGHSQSRVGKGDLGQNARNLRMLTTALRAGVEASRARLPSEQPP